MEKYYLNGIPVYRYDNEKYTEVEYRLFEDSTNRVVLHVGRKSNVRQELYTVWNFITKNLSKKSLNYVEEVYELSKEI